MPAEPQGALVDREAERWHHRPEGMVALNPLFSWPPRPMAVLRWYRGAWLQITALTHHPFKRGRC